MVLIKGRDAATPVGAGSTGGRLRMLGLIVCGLCKGITGGIIPGGRNAAPTKQSDPSVWFGRCPGGCTLSNGVRNRMLCTSLRCVGDRPAHSRDRTGHRPGGIITGTPGGPENGMPGGGSPYGYKFGGGFIGDLLHKALCLTPSLFSLLLGALSVPSLCS